MDLLAQFPEFKLDTMNPELAINRALVQVLIQTPAVILFSSTAKNLWSSELLIS